MKFQSSSLHNERRTFATNWPLHLMMAALVLLWIVLGIHPVEWKQWWIENILPVLCVGFLAFTYHRFTFSNTSYLLIAIFLALHLTGAHYAYKYSPVDFWFKNTFHAQHGISDRWVHFAYGLLLLYPVQEWISFYCSLRRGWLLGFAFSLLLSASAFFEILEMGVALVFSQAGADYMGIQGDPLDSPKDMAMALFGELGGTGCLLWLQEAGFSRREPAR
ncbi:DUF2238 domain-containing protein [Paenibacillus rigui]|uniref:DUF2238 domain-containing protein n=1 Tax=Paenibacillus rigui TaxID=554312 RepID=UPI0015C5AB07|nr:DUF2238 domain-containing protein [Paenibacillus rigui]